MDCQLQEWIEKSMCYRWLHRKASGFYYKIDLLLTYTIVVIGVINSITTFVCNTFYNDNQNVKSIETFFVTSSSLAISGIAQLQRKAKFYEKSEIHVSHSKRFEIFNRKVRNKVFLKEIDQQSIKDLIEEYDQLANSSPYIPSKVIQDFRRKYGHLRIWKPNAFYDLDDIQSSQKEHVFNVKSSFLKWKTYKSSDSPDADCNV